MECRRRDLAFLATAALAFFLYFNLRHLHRTIATLLPVHRHLGSDERLQVSSHLDHGPANATLGFGGIIAVSKRDSHRRSSLLHAANLTGIDILIPDQPVWTDADVQSIKTKKMSVISRGSAMAWLGHLNALKWFVESGLSSALILEDDVDWDIHLRNYQIPRVAKAVRKLVSDSQNNANDPYAALRQAHRPQTYWGDLKSWEILYLGHCGDYFDLKFWPELPHEIFDDESLPPLQRMHPDTEDWLREVGIHHKQRMVHKSKKPLCSFAYAVTRESAQRVLRELSTEEQNHGTWAYDVRLLEACRDLGWKCWSASPEMFHHTDEGDSDITKINGRPLFPVNLKDDDTTTPNIACGARHKAFLSTDSETLHKINEVSTDPALCLSTAMKDHDDPLRGDK
ncbi:hypothetical protein FKW77_007120 [Venturia effusa]|uniref:Glycosyltransferase family 25 protein n=1 Tax=Venturia effusa TaxID=50376 RepID=A0A517KZN0_9PEZI|nr:hypothetical protein FKW77_007120 [Venturia effusa]